ncbi:hypothetical protein [Citricoccus sp.]|uniref:hypothetical protein n=1 Tax=Citricoccus sp. TaxID=1978372 RepID=UPI00261868A3|nr:hypothetical protein [Citricoccus sp.]HRO31721.1 hypothetical protein [Citricoccus sp.]HRO94516.1 hypothetical protein [Citricoccus sp.]
MSEATHEPQTTTETVTVTKTVTTTDAADLAQQLVHDATQQQVRYEHDDAKADDWGKASFPASDPPQNY